MYKSLLSSTYTFKVSYNMDHCFVFSCRSAAKNKTMIHIVRNLESIS